MATIGKFTKNADGVYSGTLRTLTLNTKAELVPVDLAGERAPSHRLVVGSVEIGAAWTKETDRGPYLAVQFDDPSFPAPVRANLVTTDETYSLIWSREKDR